MGKWSCDSKGCEYEVTGTSGYVILSFDTKEDMYWSFESRVKLTLVLNSSDLKPEKHNSFTVSSSGFATPESSQECSIGGIPNKEVENLGTGQTLLSGPCSTDNAKCEPHRDTLLSPQVSPGDLNDDSFEDDHTIPDDLGEQNEADYSSLNQTACGETNMEKLHSADMVIENLWQQEGRRKRQMHVSCAVKPQKPSGAKKTMRTAASSAVMPQCCSTAAVQRGKKDTRKAVKFAGTAKHTPPSVLSPAQGKKLMQKGTQSQAQVSEPKSKEVQKRRQVVAPKNYDGSFQVKDGVYCEACQTIFPNRCTYLNHKRNKKKLERGKQHNCKLCENNKRFGYGKFQSEAELIVHRHVYHNSETASPDSSDKHKIPVRYHCPFCSKETITRSHLISHVKEHTGEAKYQCCTCGMFVENWPSHARTHGHTPRIKCLQCDVSFQTRGELHEHQQTHALTCSYCGLDFKSVTSRMQHIKSQHANEALKCSTCDKIFNDMSTYNSHMRYHRYQKTKECPVCGASIRYNLSAHLRYHEMKKVRAFICDKCSMQFVTRNALKNHYKCHTGERPYACDYCPKRFRAANTLAVHLRTHSQERKYVCEVCGKRTNTSYNMNIHKRIHSSHRPFPCQLCDQAFNYKASLKSHMLSRHSVQLDTVTQALPGPPSPLHSTVTGLSGSQGDA